MELIGRSIKNRFFCCRSTLLHQLPYYKHLLSLSQLSSNISNSMFWIYVFAVEAWLIGIEFYIFFWSLLFSTLDANQFLVLLVYSKFRYLLSQIQIKSALFISATDNSAIQAPFHQGFSSLLLLQTSSILQTSYRKKFNLQLALFSLYSKKIEFAKARGKQLGPG